MPLVQLMKKWLALALVWLSVPTWGLPAETPHTGESALLDGPYEAQGPVLGGGNANPAIDKSQFSILRPTPAENLRDINALYNGPYTVDAGHVQIETVGVLYSYDRHSPSGTSLTTKYLSIGSTTVRLGLLNNWDVGVTFQPHVRLQTTDRATGVVT